MWRLRLRILTYLFLGALIVPLIIFFSGAEENVADLRGEVQWVEGRLQRVVADPESREYQRATAQRYADRARRDLRWAQARMIALPVVGYLLFVVLPIELVRDYRRTMTRAPAGNGAGTAREVSEPDGTHG